MISLEGKNEIERIIDELIDRAQKTVDTMKLVEYEMTPAQLRNFLDVISTTGSIKATEVFIQYQMGRKGDTKRAWGQSGFGRKLLDEEIKFLEKKAEEISKKTKDDKKEVLIEMLKLYVGYLNRYLVYARSLRREAEESP